MKKILITGDQDYSLNITIQDIMHRVLKTNDEFIIATYGSRFGADKIVQNILSNKYIDFFRFKSYDEK